MTFFQAALFELRRRTIQRIFTTMPAAIRNRKPGGVCNFRIDVFRVFVPVGGDVEAAAALQTRGAQTQERRLDNTTTQQVWVAQALYCEPQLVIRQVSHWVSYCARQPEQLRVAQVMRS